MSDKQHPERTTIGGVNYVSEFYAQAAVRAAVDAERKRLREQEVKPLMDAIDRWREACKSIRPEVQSRAEHGIEMAYAAVRAAQEKTT